MKFGRWQQTSGGRSLQSSFLYHPRTRSSFNGYRTLFCQRPWTISRHRLVAAERPIMRVTVPRQIEGNASDSSAEVANRRGRAERIVTCGGYEVSYYQNPGILTIGVDGVQLRRFL